MRLLAGQRAIANPFRRFSILLPVLLIACSAWQGISAQDAATSASLNDPATATSTASTKSSNSSAAMPVATSVVPLSLSTQRVPYLLNQPKLSDEQQSGRGAYFIGCSDAAAGGYVDGPSRLNISTVYTQFDRYNGDSAMGNGDAFSAGTIRIVGIGSLGNESYAFNSYTDSTGVTRGLLSAIQVTTRFATFQVFSNYTYLCDRLYPTQNDSVHPNVRPASCQFGPGTVAFGIDVPLNSTYEAGTIMTQIRLTDSSNPALTISCINVKVSPYDPQQWYWGLLFWLPLCLAIAFGVACCIARLITAETSQRRAFRNRAREGGAPRFVHGKLSPIIVLGLSGRSLVTSPALLRYVTPGAWDIIFTLQYFVALAMCHVQWPDFAYPFFRQVAWSSLLGNVTLTQPAESRIDPLSTNATLPLGDIGEQMSNAASPLYMNATQSNALLNLDNNANGMELYASIVGLQPQNLFGTCLGIWLAIVAVVLVGSMVAWLIDWAAQIRDRRSKKEEVTLPPSSDPALSLMNLEKGKSHHSTTASSPRNSLANPASWKSAAGLHGKALHGNILRALMLFHLPITIVSVYQFSDAAHHSVISVALAALAFAVLTVLLPIWVLIRISRTPLQKLYEHIGTLLALGPAYHLYLPGSQLFCAVFFLHNFVIGVAVGAGQKSGTAQAIIILVAEVFAALASSLWLPWSEGAMMGPLSFMTSVLRVIMAVLVLLLTDTIGLGFSAQSWTTYVLLLLQGIYLLAALVVFIIKLIEAVIRLVWRVSFEERNSARTAGLDGAIRKIRRRKMKGLAQARPSRPASSLSHAGKEERIKLDHRASSGSYSTTTPMLVHAQSIPMLNARSASYAQYLGEGVRGPPIGARNTSRNDEEDREPIMAALPPVSTGPPRTRPFSQPEGFVRMGGGRATEDNPYEAVQKGPPRSRPQSQSGVVGTWTGQDGTRILDPRSSYFALARTPSHELSSTQAAALAASQSMMEKEEARSGTRRIAAHGEDRGAFPWGKGKDRKKVVDEEDEWSDEGTTWDSNAVARNKGPWSGVAKMSAALGNLRRTVMGDKEVGSEVEKEEEQALPTSQSEERGFQVLRAKKPSAAPREESKASRQPYDSSQGYHHLGAQRTDSANPALQPQPQQEQDVSVGHGDAFARGPLGMLQADLQRAPSSAGHTEEQPAEERFWLPPLDIETDDKRGDSLL